MVRFRSPISHKYFCSNVVPIPLACVFQMHNTYFVEAFLIMFHLVLEDRDWFFG